LKVNEKDVQRFWEWFEEKSTHFRDLESNRVAEKIRDRLLPFFSGVSVEVSEVKPHSRREVIISATSDPFGMFLVKGLVGAAPVMSGWTFTALKPPRGFSFQLTLSGISIDAQKLMFLPVQSPKSPDEIGVRVFAPRLPIRPEEAEDAIALIIETGLGEEVAAQVSLLDIVFGQPSPGSHPIETLPEYLASCRRLRNG
jgi:hypothetical protein